jgi:hypothetical protein
MQKNFVENKLYLRWDFIPGVDLLSLNLVWYFPFMNQQYRICVFCGSRNGENQEYIEVAAQLGEALVQRRWGLVYGGGSVGLMGVIARAVMQGGGHVIGVIPQSLARVEIMKDDVSELYIVETMHQRKALMAERADAFLALPGGFGTLDELFEIITWKQLAYHYKPIVLLNIAGYFDHLLEFVEHAVREGFIKADNQRLFDTSRSLDEAMTLLKK